MGTVAGDDEDLTAEEILAGETVTLRCRDCDAPMTFRVQDLERFGAALGSVEVPEALCAACTKRLGLRR